MCNVSREKVDRELLGSEQHHTTFLFCTPRSNRRYSTRNPHPSLNHKQTPSTRSQRNKTFVKIWSYQVDKLLTDLDISHTENTLFMLNSTLTVQCSNQALFAISLGFLTLTDFKNYIFESMYKACFFVSPS